MEGYITRDEHTEYAKRIDEENERQNQRIKLLEKNVSEINALTTSVKELAVNMTNMVKEQEKQGKRLEILEGRDGERWRQVAGYVITAIIGIVVGFIFKQIGM